MSDTARIAKGFESRMRHQQTVSHQLFGRAAPLYLITSEMLDSLPPHQPFHN